MNASCPIYEYNSRRGCALAPESLSLSLSLYPESLRAVFRRWWFPLSQKYRALFAELEGSFVEI